jgi:hypothetical protein
MQLKRSASGSLLSAKRSKARPRDSESENDEESDSQEDDRRVGKKTRARESAALEKSALAIERDNEALRERIRTATEEKKRLNNIMRHDAIPDAPDEDSLLQTPPTSTKAKVALGSPDSPDPYNDFDTYICRYLQPVRMKGYNQSSPTSIVVDPTRLLPGCSCLG